MMFQQKVQNLTIYHQKCGNFIYYRELVQLIAEYFDVKNKYSQIAQENNNIYEQLTKICCKNLKMSSIFKRVKGFCLKCQKKRQFFNNSQIYQFYNNNLSFCPNCIEQISNNHSNNQIVNQSIEFFLYRILQNCQKKDNLISEKFIQEKLFNNFLDDLQNEKNVRDSNSSYSKMSKYQDKQNISYNFLSIQQLVKMTKDQLIQIIVQMQNQANNKNKQLESGKKQILKIHKLLQLSKQKNHQLQQQKRHLKERLCLYEQLPANSEYNTILSNSIKLILTSKIQTQQQRRKDQQSFYQSHAQIQNLFKQKQDDGHSLLHPQKEVKLKKLQNILYQQNLTNLQSVIEENQYEIQQKIRPITRSQINTRKLTINVIQNNDIKEQMIMTSPVYNHTIKESKKDPGIIEPVNIPIFKRNQYIKN